MASRRPWLVLYNLDYSAEERVRVIHEDERGSMARFEEIWSEHLTDYAAEGEATAVRNWIRKFDR